ncbi:MAG: hypothetical protein KGH78_04455 [Candidatus Micrarchaeota archaeon]|nr:hypothetical protein [Candidatus Micrarchaeota archaeon]
MKVVRLNLSKDQAQSDQDCVLRYIGDMKVVRHIDLMGLEDALENGRMRQSGIARAYNAINNLIDLGLVWEQGEEPFNTYLLTERGEARYELLKTHKR